MLKSGHHLSNEEIRASYATLTHRGARPGLHQGGC
jgi:hypothetical protein